MLPTCVFFSASTLGHALRTRLWRAYSDLGVVISVCFGASGRALATRASLGGPIDTRERSEQERNEQNQCEERREGTNTVGNQIAYTPPQRDSNNK